MCISVYVGSCILILIVMTICLHIRDSSQRYIYTYMYSHAHMVKKNGDKQWEGFTMDACTRPVACHSGWGVQGVLLSKFSVGWRNRSIGAGISAPSPRSSGGRGVKPDLSAKAGFDTHGLRAAIMPLGSQRRPMGRRSSVTPLGFASERSPGCYLRSTCLRATMGANILSPMPVGDIARKSRLGVPKWVWREGCVL